MSTTISRRKLSQYAANELANGGSISDVALQLASYLDDTGRKSEAELLQRDIESALVEHGIVLVRTTSARALSGEAKNDIEVMIKHEFPGTKDVTIIELIDESVIAGVKIEVPGYRLDATVKAKLEKLKVA